ncbi:MAG TPA: PEGA domain-containing protein [Terriglobales bacterium]|nr:PEGA domain-containing protein [Terriglobales bacterium]
MNLVPILEFSMRHRWTALFGMMALLPLLAQGQSMGSLCVKAHPGRTGVFVDGKYLGPAANFRIARTYQVAAGEHEVKLIDPRYEELTTKVTIQAGKKTTISETLKALPPPKPPFGRLRVENADKFAAVYVNDRFMGHVGEFNNPFQGLLLNPGEYTVKIVPATGQPITQTVKVEADKTVLVK